MEVAELVLKYVEALVWPMVTVGVVWGLRDHIQGAITRMTRLETPAGSVEFTTDAREVRSDAEELAATTESDESTGGPTEQEEVPRFGAFQEAWDVAEASPIGALVSAWLLLESISTQAIDERGGPPAEWRSRPPQPTRLIEALAKLGLSPRAVSVFHDLRQLRNRALHGLDAVTPPAARDFVESARYVAREVYTLPLP
ncbi:hypothetical protein OG864_29775 [Streptomyces sp. NBC_00124]|uniref:hypothetical protein n=1 Tax=Streptomyces sp. NBC_00124 TaxID=2975662 RepID=UPI0022582706|nr:hypothetical protein [Streptomyces sp. NBC_00124]MCX5362891.1 hypothetical protein [Streptomyces sp. NBC_00124]